jgi:PIN domain nuclease of toxin-antitoxin system
VNEAGFPKTVLLDTCAVIWLANGDPLAPSAVSEIVQAGRSGGLFISPVSAWEIGMLSRPRTGHGSVLQFLPDPKSWFARVMTGPGIKEAAFSPEIAIAASHLPGDLHGDPADRLIIATARHIGAAIVTRDSRILAYAQSGHVRVVPC